jgi:predicted ferric reductase
LGAGFRWRQLLPASIAPALLTPLLLWKVPSDFLPILLGDYLALHFAVYGLLTAAGIWYLGRSAQAVGRPRFSWRRLAVAATALAAYGTLAFGLPTDAFIFNFIPGPGRWPLILAMLFGTLPYFLADEWLTRGEGARHGAYALTKVSFIVSLGIAIALNLGKLFFLAIIVPAILALFAIYGLLSGWAYRRTNHPWVAALANAVSFAWAIAVTFPIVSR